MPANLPLYDRSRKKADVGQAQMLRTCRRPQRCSHAAPRAELPTHSTILLEDPGAQHVVHAFVCLASADGSQGAHPVPHAKLSTHETTIIENFKKSQDTYDTLATLSYPSAVMMINSYVEALAATPVVIVVLRVLESYLQDRTS